MMVALVRNSNYYLFYIKSNHLYLKLYSINNHILWIYSGSISTIF